MTPPSAAAKPSRSNRRSSCRRSPDPDALDVASAESVRDVIAVAGAEGLDVVVNNAAAYVDWTESGLSANLDAARSVMKTNLYGPWLVTQAAVPLLQKSSRPRLVNVASGGGSHGDEALGLTRRGGQAASYGISKAALLALTSTLAAELEDTSIPGDVVTTVEWVMAETGTIGVRGQTDAGDPQHRAALRVEAETSTSLGDRRTRDPVAKSSVCLTYGGP